MVDKKVSLTDLVLSVVCSKGTERPFTGEYDQFGDSGTYLCRQCGLPLFRSLTKFHSGCGWPSFDEEIVGAVSYVQDSDGRRTEIVCSRCTAHLGHVFKGEKMTLKDTRHCVNSLSLDFVPSLTVNETEEAIYAAGCFWGVEYYLKQKEGVLKTEVGYLGGHTKNPTYEEICGGDTGHYEAIRVIYDPTKVTYEQLTAFFFEIHDPTQANGQGPDHGEQYLSAVFYYTQEQKQTTLKLMNQLENMNYNVKTAVLPATTFWRAETYHQDYYEKTGKSPYCHQYIKKF